MRYSRGEGWGSTPWVKWLIVGLLVLAALAVIPKLGIFGWILFFMFGVPFLKKLAAVFSQTLDDYTAGHGHDMRERRYRAPSAYDEPVDDLEYEEKAKRRPEYSVGDDGELVELDALLNEDKPKRSDKTFV